MIKIDFIFQTEIICWTPFVVTSCDKDYLWLVSDEIRHCLLSQSTTYK